MKLWVSPLLLVCLLSACTGSAASPPVAPLPSADRRSLVECGSFTVPPGITDTGATRCFTEAAQDRRPARLRFSGRTVEGDPVHEVLTVQPDGRIERLVDSRADRFGDAAVTRETCSTARPGGGRVELLSCTAPVDVPPSALPAALSDPGAPSLG